MSPSLRILLFAAFAGMLGLWLMLPRRNLRLRRIGGIPAAIALGLLASRMPGLSDWFSGAVFGTLAVVTIASATAAITLRNPVYCALWFGMSLLGTAGLFLFQGAQFLAVATIIVYAGAILVTFLFVLMLAEPNGRAVYDHTNWEGGVSVACGVFMIAVLTATITSVLGSEEPPAPCVVVTAEHRCAGVLNGDSVAQIGQSLFCRHLVAVEAAGVLLLAALIGAAIIVGHARGPLAGPPPGNHDNHNSRHGEPSPAGGDRVAPSSSPNDSGGPGRG